MDEQPRGHHAVMQAETLEQFLLANRLSRRAFLGAVAGGMAMLACGGSTQSGGGGTTKKIAFAQPDTSASVYPFLLYGAKQAGQQRGYEILESHANHQLDRQVNELNTWISEKIGGVIVLPLDNNAMLPLITKAHQNGVKFLDYSDKALPGTDGWVVFDNLGGADLVGQWVGGWVNKTLGGHAEVALLTHEIQQTGHDRIAGGIAGVMKVAPNVKVVAQHEGVLSADVLPVVQSMLQANPNLNVILCIADDGCLGALQAFMQTNPSQARQDQMCIVGWDGAVPVLQKILAGTPIRATGVLDLIGIGKAAVNAVADAIERTGNPQVNFPYKLASSDKPDVINGILTEYKNVSP